MSSVSILGFRTGRSPPTSAAAGISLLVLLLAPLACTTAVSPRFESTRAFDPVLGLGQRVRLQVVDERPDPEVLGRHGAEGFWVRYELARPAEDIVSRALFEGLSDAGFAIVEDSDVECLVEIKEFSSTFERNPFRKGSWVSSIVLEVRVRRNGVTVATRLVSEESRKEVPVFDLDGPFANSQVLESASAALTLAVEKVVADDQLVQAMHPTVHRPPVEVAGRRTTERYGSLYGRRIAVVVGVNEYESWPRLEGAVPDAQRVAESLRSRGFDEILELYDTDATRERILRTLGVELARITKTEDLVVIFFAGHGQTETLSNGEKRGYVIPVDASTDSVYSTAISMDQLRSLSGRMQAKHVYYVMDSCYSGLGFVRGIAPIEKTTDYVRKITSYRAVQMITAGQEGEMVSEQGGRGIFTTYWLRALDGEADFDGDGYVTANEIGVYVPGEVNNLTHSRQTPMYGTLEGSGQVVFRVE